MPIITLPTRPELTEIVPLSSSPDGQLNSYCMRCDLQGQSMHYAACLWRQAVLAKPDIRTPADWAPCREAASAGNCVALMMRKEEEGAEQSIFFRRAHRANQPLVEPKRSWSTGTFGTLKNAATGAATGAPALVLTPAPMPAPSPAKPRDAIDALGAAGDYSDAINAMVADNSHVEPIVVAQPKPAEPAPRPATPVAAQVGESPLAMARRLAALRAAAVAKAP